MDQVGGHVIDTVVEDLLRFITRVMISGDRSSLLLAGVTAGGLLLLAPLALITRTSLALSAGFAVLLWGVIKVPGGAVLRGCKKTKRKLQALFQQRAKVHSQLRVIAFLCCVYF
ncbi:hypothetical protein HaLaN_04742 [Haematococcus lacustris]|uniref:Uncharacterized protein n=1 Tax=Haematococcus lacustris TaxID=44745 RepID=A0A699YH92_HAELA|nr:hypothetical protein HaLaN_04742 [Haematococcus lacustris]